MRFLKTLFALTVILLATGFFAVRTRGARSFIQDRLSKCLGTAVTLDHARIGFPYVLVLDDVVSENFGTSEKTWFRAQEVRMAIGIQAGWSVSIHRCVLNICQSDKNQPLAEIFGRLAQLDLRNTSEISKLTARIRKSMILHVTDSAIRWHGNRGEEIGSAVGVHFDVSPVKVPGRTLYYHRLGVYTLESAGGVKLFDIEKEWLASDGMEDIVISKRSAHPGEKDEPGWEESGADESSEHSRPPDRLRGRWKRSDPWRTE